MTQTLPRGHFARDARHIENGRIIPAISYVDQPYVVILNDGSWLCVLTTGVGEEGERGQHVAALRSLDAGHSWSEPVAIEPPTGPEASWGAPLHVPHLGGELGRVYVFYVFNKEDLRQVIAADNYSRKRVDTLGVYAFRYSDDGGKTWSNQRYEVPIRAFEIDRKNPYGGAVRFFWSVCKPLVHNQKAFLAVHKVGSFGDGFMASSEGAILVSDNLWHESDAAKIRWETRPDGEIGLRPFAGPIGDEQNLVALSDGSLFCTFRTVAGHSAHAYSRDEGHTWTPPAPMTFGPNGRRVKHPRAANFVRRFSNGKFLYWFHNHGLKWYDGRNPAWLLGGREVATPRGLEIEWSEPEIALYDDELGSRLSYPDFIEQNGQIWLTETQKTVARVHEISPELLGWLWRENAPCNDAIFTVHGAGEIELPLLPYLWRTRGGFSLEFEFTLEDLTPHQIFFDSRDDAGQGICITLSERQTLQITLGGAPRSANSQRDGNGQIQVLWECDAGLIEAGKTQRATVIVDGGPKIISWIIDGELGDGGANRAFGWGRFHSHLDDLNGAKSARIAPNLSGEISSLSFYDRALHVNEASAKHGARL